MLALARVEVDGGSWVQWEVGGSVCLTLLENSLTLGIKNLSMAFSLAQ